MKLSLRLLLVSLGCFFGSTLKAQPGFVVDYSNTIDSHYVYNSFIPFEGILTYFGPGIYQGSMQLGISTVSGGTLVVDTLALTQQVTLQNQETANFFAEIPVTPSFFLQGGGHTVIVWPIMNPEPPNVDIDSVSFSTEIGGWLLQTESATTKQARIFPVPASDFLVLEKPAKSPTAEFTVYTIKGTVVYTGKAMEAYTRIPLDGLPAGTYIVRYSDGIQPAEIHRFVKH